MDIKEWQENVHRLAVEKGWWDDCHSPPTPREIAEKLVLIHSEVSEALEEVRKGNDAAKVYYCPGFDKPEGFPVELADVVIRVMDLCGALGIDLDRMIELKHEYNQTRPFRHGGKKL